MTDTMSPAVRNGVDTATLFATLDAVKGDPDIAKFQFRATNRWVSGTHNQSTIHGFYGAMQEMEHAGVHTFESDHPAVLVGTDNGPTPVEYLLHALAGDPLCADLVAVVERGLDHLVAVDEGDVLDLAGLELLHHRGRVDVLVAAA